MAYGGFTQIDHLKINGRPGCKRGNMMICREAFEALAPQHQCKNCLIKLGKMKALEARQGKAG